MDDFENNGFSGDSPENSTSTGYTPTQRDNETNGYYTPPQDNGTTYHYSYVNKNTAEKNEPEQPIYRENAQTDANFNSYSPYGSDAKPPKKKGNKVAAAIIIVLVVCIVAAIIGIGAAIAGRVNNATKEETDDKTTSSQQGGEVSVKESADAPLKSNDGSFTVAGVAKECMDSCVGITVYSQQYSAYEYFYGYGSGNDSNTPSKSGEGSGVIMSEANGKTYILTCAHVIADADSYTITLNNGKEYEAEFIGADAQTDIGVLAINATGLKVAEFADSEQLAVGDQVVAIGCPGGLEFMNSLTSGYISALARPISSSIGYDTECIQIDAPINPGNSGGALFNMQGQVIGINSSKIAATEYEGIGFSVPSNTAVATANSLIRVGYVEGRAKIGISYNPITSFNNAAAVIDALAQKGFEDCQGAMVINEVEPESDLVKSGIKKYDMIVAVNGKTLTSQDVITSVLADSEPGDTVKLTIARINGNEIETFEVDCKLLESKG